MPDNSDDLRLCTDEPHIDPSSKGILTGKELSGERLVNHNYRAGGLVVLVGEITTTNEWNGHGSPVARRNRVKQGKVHVARVRRRWLAFSPERHLGTAVHGESPGKCGGGFDALDGLEPRREFTENLANLRGIRELLGRNCDIKGQAIVR